MNICIVLPCFKVKSKIHIVYKKLIKLSVNKLIFVDDCCPQESVKYLSSKISNINKKKNPIRIFKEKLGSWWCNFNRISISS